MNPDPMPISRNPRFLKRRLKKLFCALLHHQEVPYLRKSARNPGRRQPETPEMPDLPEMPDHPRLTQLPRPNFPCSADRIPIRPENSPVYPIMPIRNRHPVQSPFPRRNPKVHDLKCNFYTRAHRQIQSQRWIFCFQKQNTNRQEPRLSKKETQAIQQLIAAKSFQSHYR